MSNESKVETCLLIALAALLIPARALADGGVVRVGNQPAGPYSVTVTSSPTPMKTGTNDISALVTDASGKVVMDATVTVQIQPAQGGGTLQSFPATHANATNKLYYAANVQFPTSGTWRVKVTVKGPAGGGDVYFDAKVSRAILGLSPVQFLCVAVPVLAVASVLLLRARHRPVRTGQVRTRDKVRERRGEES